MFQELKVCCKCKESKDVSSFYWNKRFQKYYYNCKECHQNYVYEHRDKSYIQDRVQMRIYNDIWRKTETGKKKILEASLRARIKFPEKWDARSKLRYAVKTGVIEKPTNCEKCDEVKTLHGHHEDYTKPLEVSWLCVKCHHKRHKELKILTQS